MSRRTRFFNEEHFFHYCYKILSGKHPIFHTAFIDEALHVAWHQPEKREPLIDALAALTYEGSLKKYNRQIKAVGKRFCDSEKTMT